MIYTLSVLIGGIVPTVHVVWVTHAVTQKNKREREKAQHWSSGFHTELLFTKNVLGYTVVVVRVRSCREDLEENVINKCTAMLHVSASWHPTHKSVMWKRISGMANAGQWLGISQL